MCVVCSPNEVDENNVTLLFTYHLLYNIKNRQISISCIMNFRGVLKRLDDNINQNRICCSDGSHS